MTNLELVGVVGTLVVFEAGGAVAELDEISLERELHHLAELEIEDVRRSGPAREPAAIAKDRHAGHAGNVVRDGRVGKRGERGRGVGAWR